MPSGRRVPCLRVGLDRRARVALAKALAVGIAAASVAGAQASRDRAPPAPRRETSSGGSVEPTSREAASWLAEKPHSLPYRLALARALVREGKPRSSLPYFDAVVARDSAPPVLAEAASAHAATGNHERAIELYRRAAERAPSRTSLQRSHARALVDRARYYLEIEDDAGAARDLEASIALRPTPEAYTLLGDVYRSRAQFKRARVAYEHAMRLRPSDRDAASRLAGLMRAERPAFGFAPSIDEEAGVVTGLEMVSDNAGFVFVWGEARLGFPLRPSTVLGLGLEPRVVRERSAAGGVPEDDVDAGPVTGVGATLGLAQQFSGEVLETRLVARAGAVGHSAGGSLPLFALGALTTHRTAGSLALEARGGPAYTELVALGMRGDTLSPPVGGSAEALLSVRSFALGATMPFGRADVAARLERLWVSDGNVRSAFEASARLPLVPGLALIYSGGMTAFRDRSPLYWDPRRDASHAVGFELGMRGDEGFALAVRALPGVGRTEEGLTPGSATGLPGPERFVRQFAADAEAAIQRPPWDAALGAAFTTGRSGGYQQLQAGFRVRYTP